MDNSTIDLGIDVLCVYFKGIGEIHNCLIILASIPIGNSPITVILGIPRLTLFSSRRGQENKKRRMIGRIIRIELLALFIIFFTEANTRVFDWQIAVSQKSGRFLFPSYGKLSFPTQTNFGLDDKCGKLRIPAGIG